MHIIRKNSKHGDLLPFTLVYTLSCGTTHMRTHPLATPK